MRDSILAKARKQITKANPFLRSPRLVGAVIGIIIGLTYNRCRDLNTEGVTPPRIDDTRSVDFLQRTPPLRQSR